MNGRNGVLFKDNGKPTPEQEGIRHLKVENWQFKLDVMTYPANHQKQSYPHALSARPER